MYDRCNSIIKKINNLFIKLFFNLLLLIRYMISSKVAWSNNYKLYTKKLYFFENVVILLTNKLFINTFSKSFYFESFFMSNYFVIINVQTKLYDNSVAWLIHLNNWFDKISTYFLLVSNFINKTLKWEILGLMNYPWLLLSHLPFRLFEFNMTHNLLSII